MYKRSIQIVYFLSIVGLIVISIWRLENPQVEPSFSKLIRAGRSHLDVGNYRRAIEQYRFALALNPSDSDARMNYEVADNLASLRDKNKRDSVETVFFEKYKNNNDLKTYLAFKDIKDKKLTKADGVLRKVVAENPRLAKAWYGLGSIAVRNEEFLEAVEYYSIAVKRRKSKVEYRTALARTYLTIGNYKKAQKQYKVAIAWNPKLLNNYLGLLYAYIKKEDFKKAQELIFEIEKKWNNEKYRDRNQNRRSFKLLLNEPSLSSWKEKEAFYDALKEKVANSVNVIQ